MKISPKNQDEFSNAQSGAPIKSEKVRKTTLERQRGRKSVLKVMMSKADVSRFIAKEEMNTASAWMKKGNGAQRGTQGLREESTVGRSS